MILFYIKRCLWFAALVLMQVLVFSHVHIGGYATAFVYIYFILTLDRNVNRLALLAWAFVLGLVVDVFTNTPGVNASATVLLAFVRPQLITLCVPRDSADDLEPGIRSMGIVPFVGYASLAILLHHTMLMIVDAFSFYDWKILVAKIFLSSLLTLLCVMALECIRWKK